MSRLRPEKLHVRLAGGMLSDGPVTPRRYTLTHSDMTGDLFLTIGPEFDTEQISGRYTRLMRDEVLAEWRDEAEGSPSLHVFCHVSGGLVLGGAAFRDAIFRRELPLVLESVRYGDRELFQAHAELDGAPVLIHFASHRRRYRRTERWGAPADYRLETP
jgi:hypothetical protein